MPRSWPRVERPGVPVAESGRGQVIELPVRRAGGGRPVRRPVLLGTVVALCLLGLIMVLSASSVDSVRARGDAWSVSIRQALWVAAGLAALLATSAVDYSFWRRLVNPLLIASIALLVLVLVPGIGITAGGSTRWLGIGGFRFQPSELAKLALLLFGADLLARRQYQIANSKASLRPVLIVTGILSLLILLQPDMGTALILVVISLTLLFVSGIPMRPLVGLGVATMVFAMVVAVVSPYRRARLVSYLDPFADATGGGYQVAQSLVALGTGSFKGIGFGASRAKWGFLPNAHTDFIFAIIGEELGLAGTLLVVVAFAVIAIIGFGAAMKATDRFGALLAAGITAWIVGQALLNMGAVTGALPVTGVPLPFVSFGGSAMVVTLAAVGILRSILRAREVKC